MLLVLLVILSPTPHSQAQAAVDRPNVLIILTDDQRASGTLSVMPHTRGLFREGGTKYANALATTPWCCPSRSSIFSGQYVHNHDVRSPADLARFNHRNTIQHELKAAGYLTAITGKFLNRWTTDPPPYFDRWATFVHPPDYFNSTFNVDGSTREVSTYSTTYLSQKALEFLEAFESEDTTPWFMQVSPFAPHGAPVPEGRFEAAELPAWRMSPATLEPSLRDKPSFVNQAKETGFGSPYDLAAVARFREHQLRTLLSVDEMVAHIFDRLEALGEADNTLAFYLSDNGIHWYEHEQWGKRLPYDQSVKIPLLTRWPGHFEPGALSKKIVANIDIAPTIFEAVDVTPSYPVDGRSLLSSDRKWLLTEYWLSDPPDIPTWASVWSPGRVYTRYTLPTGGLLREFYKKNDPWQLHNVYRDGIAGNEPRQEALLDSLLRNALSCKGASCP
jgi:arylsulfatase A-like enzyme